MENKPYAQMWESQHENNKQLWYLDQDKIIRSYATDHCLTSHGRLCIIVYLFILFLRKAIIIFISSINLILIDKGYYPALVTVEPCKNNATNQKWTLKEMSVINIENPDRCLNIRHSDKHDGAYIVEYKCHRGFNQLWEIVLK